MIRPMLQSTGHVFLSSALAFLALGCGGGATPASSPQALAAASSGRTAEPSGSSARAASGSSAASGAVAPSNPGGDALALTDAQIASITDRVHSAEIEQAELARQKSRDPRVQSFATMMIDHHWQAQRQQRALHVGEAESPLGEELTRDARSTIDSLKAKQGPEFDRAYLQAQVEGHQKVLHTIQRELRPNARDPGLGDYLEELEPQVALHLERAQEAQRELQK